MGYRDADQREGLERPEISKIEWRPVPEWEGFYEVSADGRVRSLPRRIDFDRLGQPFSRTLPGTDLQVMVSTRGYFKVSLTKPGLRTQRFIHDLVLEAFRGPKPDGLQACHNDGDKGNNSAANLRYDTCQANIDDRERHRLGR